MRIDPFINKLFTGAWMAALLFMQMARFARRFPIDGSNWIARITLNLWPYHDMNLGDSWEHADSLEYPQQFFALGIRIGVNYITYAMSH